MTLRLRPMALAAAAATFALFGASTASAATNPCGNIEITSIGECHFEFSGGCKAQCEPLSFVAACDGECNASIDANCNVECSAGCEADCEVNPGSFDCSASCETDCNASIQARCGSDQECISYCEASCTTECDASCEVVAPEADCTAQCEASCSGGCDVDANFDCNVECSAELQGGCEVQCDAPEGALFCDGQYLNITDIPACVEYLVENFEIELEFEVEITGEIDSSCTVANTGSSQSSVPGMLGLAAAAGGLAAARLRRRNKR
jgi:LPXTG-motif cell wall-anchored protein